MSYPRCSNPRCWLEYAHSGQCDTNTARSTGAGLIAAERHRQMFVEGRSLEHDAEHGDGALVRAAIVYATPGASRKWTWRNPLRDTVRIPVGWPWSGDDFKPTPNDRVRELVKAGALIAAEIDRLQVRP